MPGLNLTHTEAQQRANTVDPRSYRVELDLRASGGTFRSTTTIEFSATPGESTFVDLVSGYVHEITLNGYEQGSGVHQDNRIALGHLQAENTLRVVADMDYMHTGEGLHQFVDPADGERYCYSQFEVPDARRVFATFEQPNLKATFQFTVLTPAGWTVLSNQPTPEPIEIDGGLRFEFAPTEVISTYVTAIVAGPYAGATSALVSSDGREIPLGVYCRRSLREHLDADRIFDTTRAGFAFFEEQYGLPYPFAKYDQIFVPEFNAGAMENAGCITFRDQYIFRSQPTAWEIENRANTILHELAHMWFGDLVTMEWWNDLWLNESFAEFMSHLALAEATEFKDAWIGFLSRKEWGLSQDQLPSTHPIKADIRDLADVEVNFDGITYAKGAAVLRQLVSYVGRENFFAGLHQYLQQHSWGNATLSDLLHELQVASGRDLGAWSGQWLEEAGVNVLRPRILTEDDGTIKQLAIEQESFNADASLRPHRLIVAGYDLNEDGEVVRTMHSELDVDGPTTVVTEFTGQPRPSLIVVNDQDLAYAKVRLDDASLGFAIEHIAEIADPITRRLLVSTTWDMVRDAELPASEFVALALQLVPAEENVATLTALLQRLQTALLYYSDPAARNERVAAVASRLQLMTQAAAAYSDAQRLLVKAVARLARTPEQFDFLRSVLSGDTPLLGLDVDVDIQWALVLGLVRGGVFGETQIAEQLAADPTLTGQQFAAQARAAAAGLAERADLWQTVLHDTELPNDTLWAMVAGFWAHAGTKPAQYGPYAPDFFSQVRAVWEEHTFHIASRLVESTFPLPLAGALPDFDVAAAAGAWLDEHPGAPDALRRLITENQADAERMVAAQQFDSVGRQE